MNGEDVIGYLRYKGSEPLQPRFFLAASQAGTNELLGHIRAVGIQAGSDSKRIRLPVHPESRYAKQWISYNCSAEIAPLDAAMICVLDERCDSIRKYAERLQQKAGFIGSILWPVEFEVL